MLYINKIYICKFEKKLFIYYLLLFIKIIYEINSYKYFIIIIFNFNLLYFLY
jgi:hypothetical protein